MDRSRHSWLLIVIVCFGLYVLSQTSFYGNWHSLAYVPWTKWVLLGLGIYLVCTLLSSRPRRRRRHYREFEQNDSHRDQSAIYSKLEKMQEELSELRRCRTSNDGYSNRQYRAELDRRFEEITDRIVTLEKIVTDRRYELDEKINKL